MGDPPSCIGRLHSNPIWLLPMLNAKSLNGAFVGLGDDCAI